MKIKDKLFGLMAASIMFDTALQPEKFKVEEVKKLIMPRKQWQLRKKKLRIQKANRKINRKILN